jgi:hypothetical protein
MTGELKGAENPVNHNYGLWILLSQIETPNVEGCEGLESEDPRCYSEVMEVRGCDKGGHAARSNYHQSNHLNHRKK